MLLSFFKLLLTKVASLYDFLIAIVKPSYERIAVAQVDDKKLPEGSYTPAIQNQNEDREKAVRSWTQRERPFLSVNLCETKSHLTWLEIQLVTKKIFQPSELCHQWFLFAHADSIEYLQIDTSWLVMGWGRAACTSFLIVIWTYSNHVGSRNEQFGNVGLMRRGFTIDPCKIGPQITCIWNQKPTDSRRWKQRSGISWILASKS